MPKRNSYPVGIPCSYNRQTVLDIVAGSLPETGETVTIPRELLEAIVLVAADIVVDGQLWDRNLTDAARALSKPEFGGAAWRSSLRRNSQHLLHVLEEEGFVRIFDNSIDCAAYQAGLEVA